MLFSAVFSLTKPHLGRWLCASLALLQAGVWAQEPEAAPSHESGRNKPSAVVLKQYRCHGGKALSVRYQLGGRSVHAFVHLQGKTRELPWDGDYKIEHDEDERFSDGRYEILVQGNFSRVSAVRRLPAKEGGKPRELLRACSLRKAPGSAGTKAGGSKASAEPSSTPLPTPTGLPPSPSPEPAL